MTHKKTKMELGFEKCKGFCHTFSLWCQGFEFRVNTTSHVPESQTQFCYAFIGDYKDIDANNSVEKVNDDIYERSVQSQRWKRTTQADWNESSFEVNRADNAVNNTNSQCSWCVSGCRYTEQPTPKISNSELERIFF